MAENGCHSRGRTRDPGQNADRGRLAGAVGAQAPEGPTTRTEKLIVRRDFRDQKEAAKAAKVAIVLGPVLSNDNIEGYFVKPLRSFLMRLREE